MNMQDPVRVEQVARGNDGGRSAEALDSADDKYVVLDLLVVIRRAFGLCGLAGDQFNTGLARVAGVPEPLYGGQQEVR